MRPAFELSLVDASDLEESLALVEAANRAEVRSSQPMFSLGMRFATLAEAPMFEPEDLPIGPHRLSECVRQAAEHLDLPVEHRVLFFRCVDQSLFSRLDRFIDDWTCDACRASVDVRTLRCALCPVTAPKQAWKQTVNGKWVRKHY